MEGELVGEVGAEEAGFHPKERLEVRVAHTAGDILVEFDNELEEGREFFDLQTFFRTDSLEMVGFSHSKHKLGPALGAIQECRLHSVGVHSRNMLVDSRNGGADFLQTLGLRFCLPPQVVHFGFGTTSRLEFWTLGNGL